MSYYDLWQLRRRLANSRRVARWLGHEDLAGRLDAHLDALGALEQRLAAFVANNLSSTPDEIEQACKEVEARLDAEARRAFCISGIDPDKSRFQSHYVLELAVRYREAASLAVDRKQQQELGERALQLARLANELAVAS
jgi:single-stranded DNA-specific DHH superfamily exonuclease